MGPISAEIEIDAPRERVFATIADLALRSCFTDHFLTDFHLTRLDSTGVGAGARFRVSSPLRSVWMDTTIAELEAPHRLVERGRGGRTNRIAVSTVWELTESAGPLARVRLSRWTEPSNSLDRALELAAANSVWEQRGWREALQRLRDRLESDEDALAPLVVAGGNAHATGIP
ncbi:MAG TPA: SRPBCC family protein [Solirubrobacterales bacterium]|nr:SRPBCC family protein [Solirubrobacterales bacterium]